jgi:hypothetical protein
MNHILSISLQGEFMSKFLQIMTITLLVLFLCSTASFSQTGKWTQLFPKNSPPAIQQNCLSYLTDGKALLFGGYNFSSKFYGGSWLYDFSNNEWTEIKCDSSPLPRVHSTMTHIADGKVLLFGGDLYQSYANDTWVFDLESMKWIELHPQKKPYRRDRASSAYLSENKILLYSGNGCPINYSVYEDCYCHDTWIFDLEKIEWDSIINNYPRGREGAQMCEIDSDRIVLYGGHTSTIINTDMFIFNKTTNKWTKFRPRINNLHRDASSMVKVEEDIAFVFGGRTDEGIVDDSWILNMRDSMWIELKLDTKPRGRSSYQMTKLAPGKVLLFGGAINGSELGDTWLFEYDPTGVKDSTNVLFAQVKVINKATGNCEIQLSNLSAGTIEIELYNTNGDFVKQLYSNYNAQPSFNLEFNTAEFSSGAYFLEIKTKNATYHKQIMVVR